MAPLSLHHNSRRPTSSSRSSQKQLILLSFFTLLTIGTIFYLRALSFVSNGLDERMASQAKLLALLNGPDKSGSSEQQKRKMNRGKDDKVKHSLRGEDVVSEQQDDDEEDADTEFDDQLDEDKSPPLQQNKDITVNNPPPTPPWHMVSDPDDSFERNYIPLSDRSKYKNVRDLSKDVNKGAGIKHFFNPLCRHYRFDEDALPTVSVIMTTQNEPDDWVSISVESILARTPPNLLVDVIVVDDNGIPGKHGLPPNIRRNVNESEFEYIKSLSPKVQVIQHSNREGCARSRLSGARAAKGQVLMFVDSHVEMLSATWYHHLAIAIVENPRTIAMQTIDVIDDLGSRDYGSGAGPLQFGIVNNEFWFGYQVDRFGDYMDPIYPQNFTKEEIDQRKKFKYEKEVPGNRFPYETPFGPGSLFAIRADEFWRLGGYDEGLYVWGGENTELAFKIWMCGGRMLMVPCSRVGHMYRQHKEKDGRGALTRWPPDLPQEMTDRLGCAYKNGTYTGKFIVLKHPADNFTRITTRNNLRVMETWVGDHPAKKMYYKRMFGQEELKPEFQRFIDEWKVDPVAQKQVRLKEENKCHDFEWWDKYVMMRLTGRHHPWHIDNKKYQQVNCGNHKAKNCGLCPQDKGASYCHGDCAWCGATEKCIEYDDAQKPECKKKPTTTTKPPPATEKKVERALVPAGIDTHQLTISVVLPCGFEHEFFERTAKSVFDETPEGVLKEIVIVDDASSPPLIESVSEEVIKNYNIKMVRLDSPAGLIGAKQAGAEAATGDIIVFFDCHVKPGKDYWVPYVKNIHENYKRVVIPVITNLNVDTWEEFNRPAAGGGMSKCYLTFDAEFKWTTDDTPNVPIMSGGLLAISRDWFFEIGGYDKSMLGWGGENLDQSLRIWTCGGEIVSAPDSFVAHMWRDGTEKTRAKYKLTSGDAAKNQARAVKAHMGPWFEKTLSFPKYNVFKDKDLDISVITDVTKKHGCQDFQWYLDKFKYIYRDAGVIPTEVFQIEATSGKCLKLKKMQWTNYGTPDELELADCIEGSEIQQKSQYWHLGNRKENGKCCGGIRAWNTDQCIDGRSPKETEDKVPTYGCDLAGGLETALKPKEGASDEYLLALGKGQEHGKLCVSVKDSKPIITGCDNAVTWKKRNPFTPLEFTLLSDEAKESWRN